MYSILKTISIFIIPIATTRSTRYFSDCNNDWLNNVNYHTDTDRVYYIACVEEEWDYCPTGLNLITGEPITANSKAGTYCHGNGIDRIGPTYYKALYREYTNQCFTQQKQRDPNDLHLGSLGPNIRALTGETIKIFYKNMCSMPTSLHAHGLKYDKTSEGSPYDDQFTAGNGGDSVSPGGQWIYIFEARPNMVDQGASSKMWLYHSHVDEVRDIYAGLFGAIIITKNGMETSENNLIPNDIDREFTTFFVLYDENESWLFDRNAQTFLDPSLPIRGGRWIGGMADFIESNSMHAVNGYLFGNLNDLICNNYEKVRWYVASFGNEIDGPHSPHWHGNIVVDTLDDNTDTVVLIPGTTYTVTMDVDSPGKWLYHCHVHDHIEAGMITTYTVL